MNHIKEKLLNLGLRPADLARACAISPGTLSQYLNGKRECPEYRRRQFETWLKLQELLRQVEAYEAGTHYLVSDDFKKFRKALRRAWFRLQNMDTDRSLCFTDDQYLMMANDMEKENLTPLENKLYQLYQGIDNEIDKLLEGLDEEDQERLKE